MSRTPASWGCECRGPWASSALMPLKRRPGPQLDLEPHQRPHHHPPGCPGTAWGAGFQAERRGWLTDDCSSVT